MNMNRHPGFLGAVLVFLLISMVLSACTTPTPEASDPVPEESTAQTTTAPDVETEPVQTTQPAEQFVQIQTKYLALTYSDVYATVLQHREVSSEAVTMEIFSLDAHSTEMELFRIYFGDETAGILSGYLSVDGEEIPVTYTICQYSDEEFADEEIRSVYLETMNCFNDIMNSIQEDGRFSLEKAEEPVDQKDAVSAYWTFSLPETMEYEEERDGQYKLHFYGNVAGERIALYTIILGEPCGSTVIGTYELDGNKQLLSVESYVLEPKEHWSEEDTKSAYVMMGTVNDVLQTIMSSEHFSEEIPR